MLTPFLIPSGSYSLASIKSLITINWVRGSTPEQKSSPHQAIWRGKRLTPSGLWVVPMETNKFLPSRAQSSPSLPLDLIPGTGFIRLQSIIKCYRKKNALDCLRTWDKLAEEIVSWERILKRRLSSPPWSGSKWTMMNSNAYFLQFWHICSQDTSAIFLMHN